MSRWNAKVKGASPESSPERRPGLQSGQRPAPVSAGLARDLKAAMEGAQELMKAERFDEALKAYEAILEKHPEAVPAYVGIGNIHARSGDYNGALEYYAEIGRAHV